MTGKTTGSPSAKAIPFVLVGMTGTETDPVLRALGLNPQRPGMRVYPTTAALTAAVPAANLASLPVVALSTNCATYLAGSMAAGLNAEEACQAWHRAADDFLALCRANRSRTLILDAKTACAAPSAMRHALLERFDYALNGQDAPHPTQPTTVLHLLAQDLTRREAPLRRAQAELDASVKPLAGVATDAAPDAATLLADIRRAQDDQQQTRDAALTLQQALDIANNRITLLEDTALEGGTMAELELEQTTAHLTQRTADCAQLRAELEAVMTALHAAQAEIAALRSSTSWKLTGPIRRARRLLSRGA